MFKNLLLLILISLQLNGCRLPDHSGFNAPISLSMAVPDGPPEFKAGWYAGCKSGNSTGTFANNWSNKVKNTANFGSGVYDHDAMFQTGWSQGWFSCVINAGTFAARNSMQHSPLN